MADKKCPQCAKYAGIPAECKDDPAAGRKLLKEQPHTPESPPRLWHCTVCRHEWRG